MWQIWLFWTVRTFAHLEDDNGHVMPVVNKIWHLGFFCSVWVLAREET